MPLAPCSHGRVPRRTFDPGGLAGDFPGRPPGFVDKGQNCAPAKGAVCVGNVHREKRLESDRPGRRPGARARGDVAGICAAAGYTAPRNYSEHTARAIDAAVTEIVASAFKRALDLLARNRATLESAAARLLERETLTEPDLISIAAQLRQPRSPEVDACQIAAAPSPLP